MKKDIILYEEEDRYEETQRQVLKLDKKVIFSVCNLDEYPEDAIIDRDLFSAYEFIEAVELGMKLAQEGYTELNIIEEKE